MERISQDSKLEQPPAAHGGDLSRAIAIFGGRAEDWLDLSTGVNACPYPITAPEPASPVWTRLPDASAAATLAECARRAYRPAPEACITPTHGAQAAIQLLPKLLKPQADEAQPVAAILSPTYAEHQRAFAAAGWWVAEASSLEEAYGAAAAVVVNPNNPDGRLYSPSELSRLRDYTGHLIVDESFVDETPERSVAEMCGGEDLTVLRSVGKFYGLPGLRLGFAITGAKLAARLAAALGPWSVSGPALHFGAQALQDDAWAEQTRRKLRGNAPRLKAMGEEIGLKSLGGAGLFHSFLAPDAAALQNSLAERRIWTRIWAERPGWIRLGAPGPEEDWLRLQTALRQVAQKAKTT